jgi:hypothetical protein
VVSWPPLEVVQLGRHWGDFKDCSIVLLPLPSLLLPWHSQSLLNFWSTSAVLPLHEISPFNALVRSNAAFMMSVLGVTCGFVIYWCLKNTVSLILVALVFTMYMWKYQ